MTPDQLAERIMDRIEKDQAIHKSSIVEELQLACAPAVKTLVQRDGYPVQPETGTEILHHYNTQIRQAQQRLSQRARKQVIFTAEDRIELRKFLEALDQ